MLYRIIKKKSKQNFLDNWRIGIPIFGDSDVVNKSPNSRHRTLQNIRIRIVQIFEDGALKFPNSDLKTRSRPENEKPGNEKLNSRFKPEKKSFKTWKRPFPSLL